MHVFNEALEYLVGQLEQNEDWIKFATNICNMMFSQIILLLHDRHEDVVELLSYTDTNFLIGCWS